MLYSMIDQTHHPISKFSVSGKLSIQIIFCVGKDYQVGKLAYEYFNAMRFQYLVLRESFGDSIEYVRSRLGGLAVQRLNHARVSVAQDLEPLQEKPRLRLRMHKSKYSSRSFKMTTLRQNVDAFDLHHLGLDPNYLP